MTHQTTIVYDPEMDDYAMILDGEVVGFARTPQEATDTLTTLLDELDRYVTLQRGREAA